jgi:hypothetical protein
MKLSPGASHPPLPGLGSGRRLRDASTLGVVPRVARDDGVTSPLFL